MVKINSYLNIISIQCIMSGACRGTMPSCSLQGLTAIAHTIRHMLVLDVVQLYQVHRFCKRLQLRPGRMEA